MLVVDPLVSKKKILFRDALSIFMGTPNDLILGPHLVPRPFQV